MTTPTSQTGTQAGAADHMDQIVGQAKAQVAQAKTRISEQARTSVQNAKDRAGSAFTERKGQLSGQITGVAGAVRRGTEQLRDEGHGQIAEYAESLADSVDRAGTYLRDADIHRLRNDLEDLARRQPVLVVGGALALGVIAARFLRSSERSAERGPAHRFGQTDGDWHDSDATRSLAGTKAETTGSFPESYSTAPGAAEPGTGAGGAGSADTGGFDGAR